MRVMVMVKANEESEAGTMPSEEELAAMGAYNEELVKAGIMLDGDGLHPSSKGVRIQFSGDQRTVVDGPFAETKELIAGYWIWQVRDMDEAIESAKLIAALTRIVRDVGLAEELAQDALVAALEQWPESGVPDNPAAWLMAASKQRAIDLLRRSSTLERKRAELARELELELGREGQDLDAALDDYVGDDLLRLMFLTCHPVLSKEARTALTLRLLGGLTTDEIARAFLVAEPTVAQRIVRAKRTLAAARVPCELPPREELGARLASVR